MNYAQARQIQDGPNKGKWHWTTRNDNVIRADGYCSSRQSCPDCDGWAGLIPDRECSACDNKGLVDRVPVCEGHDTAEEAAEHYRQYLLDNAKFVEVNDADSIQLLICKMCDKHTASYMHVKGDAYRHDSVCPEHHNRKTAEFLIEQPGVVISS